MWMICYGVGLFDGFSQGGRVGACTADIHKSFIITSRNIHEIFTINLRYFFAMNFYMTLFIFMVCLIHTHTHYTLHLFTTLLRGSP